MISQNALHHAEKCRFCWMCRHLCPVQHQTGKELNTPRAKGLLLSMVNKKAQEFDKDMGQAMYECLLCDACTNDCATGYQPPLFIREARTEAVIHPVAIADGQNRLLRRDKFPFDLLHRSCFLSLFQQSSLNAPGSPRSMSASGLAQ